MEQENQNDWDERFREEANAEKVPAQPETNSQSRMALASLVMGIIGIVTTCCMGGLFFGSLGILFALLSRTEQRFESYAKGGLITSAIAIGMSVIIRLVFAAYIMLAGL